MRLACQQLHISRYDRESKPGFRITRQACISHLASISRSLHMEHILSVLILHTCMLGLVQHIQSRKSHADKRLHNY